MYRKITDILMFFTAIGIFCSTTFLYAQETESSTAVISGTVVNSNGEPVSNVFVKSFEAKGKSITNKEGGFSLEVTSLDIDKIVIEEDGYLLSITETNFGVLENPTIVLTSSNFMENGVVSLPYQKFSNNRSVSATYTITGDELATYPSGTFLETLSGRIPGMQVNTFSNNPVNESVFATIRGEGVSFYIDGILRDPSDLTIYEVESVQVIKDYAGRSALGLSGLGPVVWITTKTGTKYKRDISISTESGFSSPTAKPEYLNSYNYATLYNEALVNDGLTPLYSSTALAAYRDNTDPLYYPNVDYMNDYIRKSGVYRRANINFSGGDDKVNYFSLLDYVRTTGLEKIGEDTSSDRYKVRGGVNIKLTDKIQFNVNLSGTYQELAFPNQNGGASQFNIFNYISSTPPNAHAIAYEGNYIVSNDFPTNIENILFSGYAEGYNLNSQNNATLMLDLGGITKGLTFTGTAAFDIYSNVINNKGGTAALYTLLPNNVLQLYTDEVVDPNLTTGNDSFTRSTTALLSLNYDRMFGNHALTLNTSFYNGLVETRRFANYQPAKRKDLSFRANYAYNDKYVLQVDLAYSGSMKLPDGDRYNVYPTAGAAWVLSNESFLSSSKTVNYLKLFTSYGVMGNDNFRTGFNTSYNPYYLGTTLWQNVGSWASGIEGNQGAFVNVYNIQQEGSTDYELPKISNLNIGLQGELFDKALSFEANYYARRNYNQISQRSSLTPSLFGTGGFLPLTNYGETKYWGIDGYLQYQNSVGDFNYSLGGNIMYNRSKYIDVDEPAALEDYRKLAGTDTDMFRGYASEGLYQSEDEITSRNVTQSWGAVQPGDIRYQDYNNDGIVDEKDIHVTGAHAPRIYYGLNLNLKYKGFGLFVVGQGLANGVANLGGNYFMGSNPRANYSEVMLDRYPETNSIPRLTTQSQNNYQNSTFWLRDGAYFSIKNIELSYTMPKAIATNFMLPNLKFFARAKNVASFSKFSKYDIDPENTSAGVSTFPIYRTFTLGVSCKF
ncbi:SusC/RagA family TonB-linked outer membrane protein [Aestuariibaculum sp. YM273]|uniref:SusC/RagA family TonB-linked outer membrane protein n=1 Tax=Aestuariibaculum sp. YM273 TaxID=3070659 RepID=UPI0027DD5B29|nr:SusC/RagA family TonB-linked outer membrane protein [Aestuariibaculum sp. YM273]WMI65213.1 SusC/RagA family TonB-linked outer membrane protein [Aestuariibaculum sp. YM273]